jgi:hypothetical protein
MLNISSKLGSLNARCDLNSSAQQLPFELPGPLAIHGADKAGADATKEQANHIAMMPNLNGRASKRTGSHYFRDS